MKALRQAAQDRLESVWSADQVHEMGKVPKSPVTPYGALAASSPGYGNVNTAAQAGSKSYRLVVQIVGKTIGEVENGVEFAEQAFITNGPLVVEGYDVAPIDPSEVVASQPIRDPDAGAYLVCALIYPITAHPTA